jgi:4-hydroxy-2-oxoheptanedioate aldolase
MHTPTLKTRLAAGQCVVGAWLSLADPACAEALSRQGFDFLVIDGEHAPFSPESLRALLMAATGSPTDVIVRVPVNDLVPIKMALDLGAAGIVVPMVNSAEQARRAVSAARYPPAGARGIGPWRASTYYQHMMDYVMAANDLISLIIQIEHTDALAALDDILAVPGYDAVLIGPADLTASLGLLPDTAHPHVQAAIHRIAAACRAAGMPFGADGPHNVALRAHGATFFTVGMDVSFLIESAQAALNIARASLSPAP